MKRERQYFPIGGDDTLDVVIGVLEASKTPGEAEILIDDVVLRAETL